MSGVSILVTTINSAAKAQELARAVLARKLVACVQITPITSYYVWNGETCETAEFRLEMKHRTADYAALAELVRQLHGYETPEILRIDAAAVDPAYGAWLCEAMRHD